MQNIKKIHLIDSGPRMPDGHTDGPGESDNPPNGRKLPGAKNEECIVHVFRKVCVKYKSNPINCTEI